MIVEQMDKPKYHYFYKITNRLNGHYYYGVHSTYNLDDGYMGSGKRLHIAYKKYGIECFEKEILKFFNTRKECEEYEESVVNEILIADDNCYNCVPGGGTLKTPGKACFIDENGNIIQTTTEDAHKRGLRGNAVGTTLVIVDGKYVMTDVDKLNDYDSFKYPMSGKITVYDKNNNHYVVSCDDKRYISGELRPFWSGKKLSEETKTKIKTSLSLIHHQQGEKNSQYGTCWITKNNENKKIKKENLETYLNDGWVKGRFIKH